MVKFVDDVLNKITMYRLVLYFLIALLLLATFLSFLKLLPFDFISLIFSATLLLAVCWVANTIFTKIFRASTNLESVYISALILTLIITPARTFQDMIFLVVTGVLAMASKYILAIRKKHIFNPAALAVLLTGNASWWVGHSWMMPAVLLGGLLIARKIRKVTMILTFFLSFVIFARGLSLESPVFFLALVMLTEPQTTPPAKKLQITYGALVGALTVIMVPEAALLIGNIFSYIVSPKQKLILRLKEKIKIAKDSYELVFNSDRKINFLPGQYLEWMLTHKNPDSRGVRRYFTIASSPTEENLRIGVKFYPNASSFKKALIAMDKGDKIVASQLAGEFTLPKDPGQKICFIAGGVGITPFRSMIKYLLDKKEKRDIILLYSNKTEEEISYQNIFNEALEKLGIKTVFVNTDTMGYIDEDMIKKEVTDFLERIFYISGPYSMVDIFEKTLKEMGVKNIKVDFFPGY